MSLGSSKELRTHRDIHLERLDRGDGVLRPTLECQLQGGALVITQNGAELAEKVIQWL